jgi:hypothetical protein
MAGVLTVPRRPKSEVPQPGGETTNMRVSRADVVFLRRLMGYVGASSTGEALSAFIRLRGWELLDGFIDAERKKRGQ